MIITEKTVYLVGGQQFDSIEKAEAHETDIVGAFMDAHLLDGIVFSPAQRIKLCENLMRNRNALVKLLEQ